MPDLLFLKNKFVQLIVQLYVPLLANSRTMLAVSISQLRSNMKKYFDEVTDSSETLIVSRSSDDDAVVIISIQEYNALKETEYLLATEANRKRLERSVEQVSKGKTRKFEP
jgi:antitoxin YefM